MEDEYIPELILIEDLGRLYPTETSKQKARYGIYECGFCGKHFKALTNNVNRGRTKSCGCYQISQVIKANKTHGDIKNTLYSAWINMKTRTTNKNTKDYSGYGGRGITICDEWITDFVAFRDWALANGYDKGKGLSLDRIDVNGNYEPSNCRWTTQIIQSRNQRMPKNNTSGYRGVSFHKRGNKFEARIRINYKTIHIGYFKTTVEGAIAYNNYIIENNLEGFILNVIPEEYQHLIKQERK